MHLSLSSVNILRSSIVWLSLMVPLLSSCAAKKIIYMHRITDQGVKEQIGSVVAFDTSNGLVIQPDLRDLPAGEHGFHLHSVGNCEPSEMGGRKVAGHSADGHWDPENTGTHQGPYGTGHLGDLSRLIVSEDKLARTRAYAPRLRVSDLSGKALMIHAGGDTYSDTPNLGGGGARIACGVID